jgi:hypothetical protein
LEHESQARFKSASGCPETASYSRPVTTRNAESFVPQGAEVRLTRFCD